MQKQRNNYIKTKNEQYKKQYDNIFHEIYQDLDDLQSVIITTKVLDMDKFKFGANSRIEGEQDILDDLKNHALYQIYKYIPKIDLNRKLYSILQAIIYHSSLTHYYSFYQVKFPIMYVPDLDMDITDDIVDNNEIYYILKNLNENIINDILRDQNKEVIEDTSSTNIVQDIIEFFTKLDSLIIETYSDDYRNMRKFVTLNNMVYLFYIQNYNSLQFYTNLIFKKRLVQIKNDINVIIIRRFIEYIYKSVSNIINDGINKNCIYYTNINQYQKLFISQLDRIS